MVFIVPPILDRVYATHVSCKCICNTVRRRAVALFVFIAEQSLYRYANAVRVGHMGRLKNVGVPIGPDIAVQSVHRVVRKLPSTVKY